MKHDLRCFDMEEMEQLVAELMQPKFRAKQLFDWIHGKGVQQITQMHNLGKPFLSRLDESFSIHCLRLVEKQCAKDGTEKYLFQLIDGNVIECVLMRYRGDLSKQRNTLCVSSQVGCAMGCTFCATGQSGFVRNLTVGEILGQVYEVNHMLQKDGGQLSVGNVVFMGMGEPLLNLSAVYKAICLLNHQEGQNIGIRRITVSTCGIVPKIRELAKYKKDIVLAISLHAPNDGLRSSIMPINQQYPLAQLIAVCHDYQQQTHNRITLEYALIKGFNDQPKHTQQLKQLLRGLDCHLNVIPVNPVTGTGFHRPDKGDVAAFIQALKLSGMNASVREEKGVDIDGACGQLRGKLQSRQALV